MTRKKRKKNKVVRNFFWGRAALGRRRLIRGGSGASRGLLCLSRAFPASIVSSKNVGALRIVAWALIVSNGAQLRSITIGDGGAVLVGCGPGLDALVENLFTGRRARVVGFDSLGGEGRNCVEGAGRSLLGWDSLASCFLIAVRSVQRN